MFALLLGCSLITSEDYDGRWDLDGDDLPRPNDCDDDDPDVQRRSWYRDGDGDGHGAGAPVDQCQAPDESYVESARDCDDERAEAFRGPSSTATS
ncbi:MAG TPA: hypothetical protein QGF58_29425 [Myxococcota bacterium]|nr:hypothetical protein [Myxococcota bacterium]